MYHCLTGPKGYLRDHRNDLISDQDDIWTQDPAQSLRFLCLEPAAKRIRLLSNLLPGLSYRLVSFQYASGGAWMPLDE